MTSDRTKIFVLLVLVLGAVSFGLTLQHGFAHQFRFGVYLIAVLLSSGMKVRMLKSDGTMSVNFPFILLGMVDLPPTEVVCLGICSVIAQCNFDVVRPFTLVQIAFNIANVTTSTALATMVFGLLDRTPLGLAPAVTCAAGLYFLLNTSPVATVIAFESSCSPWRIWRSDFFWYFPFYLVGALIAAAAALLSRRFGWPTAMLLLPLVYVIYRTYNEQIANLKAKEEHMRETEALHLRTIEGLAMAVEAKDQGTHRHLQRVRVYVSELGRIMKLDNDLTQALLTAAFLHDIGKLAVPERIINKPGKLTKEEFDQMKVHPVVGADILARVRFPYPVVPIVRSHHESWDGSGYPDGLKGEEIPLGARILSVVDCFDALASDRPYRKALSPADALAVVKSKAGIQFDAAIVTLLETHLTHLEDQAALQMDSVAPLNTDLFIERGASPGAGFQVEAEETTCSPHTGQDGDRSGIRQDNDEVALATLEADALLQFSQNMARTLSSDQVCALMARRLSGPVPYDCFAVYIRENKTLALVYKHGNGSTAFSSDSIQMGEGITGWVAETELPSMNGNPTVEPTHIPAKSSFTPQSSALSIPLFEASGPLLGVLSLYSTSGGAYSNHHLRILQAMQKQFSSALQLRRANATAVKLHVQSEGPNCATDSALRSKEPELSLIRTQANGTVIEEELVSACSTS